MSASIESILIPEFSLAGGKKLKDVNVAYQTHGSLNPEKDNAILVFHALSGSAHIAGFNDKFANQNRFWTKDNYVGWWDGIIGDKKIIDTEKNFVICQNILGGCYGTTGPSSINPETGKHYGSAFPNISIEDMVRLQKIVLEKLGVKKLKCVIGSSLGGYLVLEYCFLFGADVDKAIIIGSSARTSTLNKLLGFEQIIAIENDFYYKGGNYYSGRAPESGLMLARIIAAKTYVDIDAISKRAKKETILPNDYFYDYKFSHHIESYMCHQGRKFTKRFDPNTYLRIVKAIQDFDLAKKYGADSLEKAFKKLNQNKTKFLVVSINSDVCYYPEEQQELVKALKSNSVECIYAVVDSKKGHDSFLIEPGKYAFISGFLENFINEELVSLRKTIM
ncbi:MAG: homoserine O-acetyltransferase [archaeon]|nr:homoserine O-acetyltransferase [archaeon]